MKKFISAFLAFSVVFGGITVYAEDEFTDNDAAETSAAEETEMSTEEETEDTSEIYEETYEETVCDDVIVSMELPVVNDDAFDFILDPQQLITKTNAAKYDGALFEEDATMYFKNSEGEYEYSHNSDMLTIVNYGNVPLNVTVEIELSTAFAISQDKSFPDKEDMIYIELFDSCGNTVPLDKDGKAEINISLCESGMMGDKDIYSFGLSGACNEEANWIYYRNSDEECKLNVRWSVEPVIEDHFMSEMSVEPENADTEEETVSSETYAVNNNSETEANSAETSEETEAVTEWFAEVTERAAGMTEDFSESSDAETETDAENKDETENVSESIESDL